MNRSIDIPLDGIVIGSSSNGSSISNGRMYCPPVPGCRLGGTRNESIVPPQPPLDRCDDDGPMKLYGLDDDDAACTSALRLPWISENRAPQLSEPVRASAIVGRDGGDDERPTSGFQLSSPTSTTNTTSETKRTGPLGNFGMLVSVLVRGEPSVAKDKSPLRRLGDEDGNGNGNGGGNEHSVQASSSSSTDNDGSETDASVTDDDDATAATEELSSSSSSVSSYVDDDDDDDEVDCGLPTLRVRFAPTISDTHYVPHFSQFSTAERNSAWMSRMELRACKKQCLKVVDQMNHVQVEAELAALLDSKEATQDVIDALLERELPSHYDEAEIDPRGLEKYTSRYCAHHKTLRRSAYEAVFGLQKFQTHMKVSVPDLIADLYSTTCEPARTAALARGYADAAEVGMMGSDCYPKGSHSPTNRVFAKSESM